MTMCTTLSFGDFTSDVLFQICRSYCTQDNQKHSQIPGGCKVRDQCPGKNTGEGPGG